jgi:adenine deaminase
MIDIESRVRYGLYVSENDGFTQEEVKEINKEIYDRRSNSDICLMDDDEEPKEAQFVPSERDGFEAFNR